MTAGILLTASVIVALVVTLYRLFGESMSKLTEQALAHNEDGRRLKLRSLGMFKKGNKIYNLNCYYLDKHNNLYSRNSSSWEIDPKRGYDILKCSNGSRDGSGRIVNSLRTGLGTKVTIPRNYLEYGHLETPVLRFKVKEVAGGRKFNILSREF